MSLFDKPLLQVGEDDLLGLIADQEGEGKTLDYKRDAVGSSDSDRKEFLYDASSFANTGGGHLIFGIEEAGGLPTKLVGLTGVDPDKEILRLEQMVRHGVRPPMSIETTAVELANGNVAIVIWIPRSWNPPHQVTFQNSFRFYARNSKGKYQLDVDELRAIFSGSAAISENIRSFRANRVAKIAADDAPVALLDSGILVLHLVPFSAFELGSGFPIRAASLSPRKFAPFGNNSPLHRVTFDGLLTTSNSEPPPKPQRAYVQVFRNGVVESVNSTIATQAGWMKLPELQAAVIAYADLYARSLRDFGVDSPIAVLVSFLGVMGKRLLRDFELRGALLEDLPSETLGKDQFHFVESVFETVPSNQKEAAKRLRETLDHMANAAGLPTSPYFDANGDYELKI